MTHLNICCWLWYSTKGVSSNYWTYWSVIATWRIWLVLYFEGRFCPIFGQSGDDFFLRSLDHCLTKRVWISSTYVYVFKYSISCFVCVFKLLLKFIPLKVFTADIIVYAYVTANDAGFKHPKCRWLPFKTVKFQIHDSWPPLKILQVSKISCNWNISRTKNYIYFIIIIIIIIIATIKAQHLFLFPSVLDICL